MPSKFKVGDIVKLKNGNAPIAVIRVTDKCSTYKDHYVYGRYTSSSHELNRWEDEFEFYNNETQEGTNDMTTLYEIKDGINVKFATKLAVNSQGQWVMEEKGTGIVFSIDKKNAVEVTPYTIEIQFLGNTNGIKYSYFAEAGKYKVGDMFSVKSGVTGLGIAVVVDIDSRSKGATKDFAPIVLQKFVTEAV